jgi:polyhydroxyalkanoate synthesis regulator phasin
MSDNNPFDMIEDIRSWVNNELEGIEIPNNDQLNDRYNKIVKIIKMSEKESLPVSQELLNEKKQIEEDLKDFALSDEELQEVLSVAEKLSELSKQIKKQVNQLKNPGKQEKKSPTIMCVKFNDGTVIQKDNAVDTFLEALEYIGLEKIASQTNIIAQGHALVSRKKNLRPSAKEIDGYYIETHSSTKQKKRWLERIAEKLNIGIECEIIKK